MKKQKKERKAFNFLLSYYEVFNMLPSAEEQSKFIKAICEKQFFGKEIQLEGMSQFAYVSQKHSIERSRQGWEDIQKKEDSEIPSVGPSVGPIQGPSGYPSGQVKEEEKEKEKEEVKEQVKVKEKVKEKKEEEEKENKLEIDQLFEQSINLIEEYKLDEVMVNDYLMHLMKNSISKTYDELFNDIIKMK